MPLAALCSLYVPKFIKLALFNLAHPVAFETLGPANFSAVDFFTNLSRKIGLSFGEDREGYSYSSAVHCCGALQRNFAT